MEGYSGSLTSSTISDVQLIRKRAVNPLEELDRIRAHRLCDRAELDQVEPAHPCLNDGDMPLTAPDALGQLGLGHAGLFAGRGKDLDERPICRRELRFRHTYAPTKRGA